MREIKFRAWFKDTNDMVEWKELMGFKGLADLLNDAKNDYPSVKVMQYTGMKDKNGRQIYEGDILKRTVHVRAYGTNLDEYVDDYLEVEFRDEYAGFFCGERPLNNFVGAKFDVWTQCPCTDAEIIGNIYQNPELLKSGDPT